MEKIYKVVFVYPDGHIEEIEDVFKNGKEALEYGNNLLVQVRNTEGVFSRREIDDIFKQKESIKPHFMIIEIVGKKYHLVYESKNN